MLLYGCFFAWRANLDLSSPLLQGVVSHTLIIITILQNQYYYNYCYYYYVDQSRIKTKYFSDILDSFHIWIGQAFLKSWLRPCPKGLFLGFQGILPMLPMEAYMCIIPHSRAALMEGDQLMSSPPVWLVSSWAHGHSDFPKKYLFSSPAIKKWIFIGGDLLTLPCLFNFKMCWRGTKVSITLNTAWMYTLEIVKRAWQR